MFLKHGIHTIKIPIIIQDAKQMDTNTSFIRLTNIPKGETEKRRTIHRKITPVLFSTPTTPGHEFKTRGYFLKSSN